MGQLRRAAARVVAELHAWARRDRDGWDVARASSGRPPRPVDQAAARARGCAASAAARRGIPRGTA